MFTPRIGIVVVSSPARSHPSTELLDSVLSSLDRFEGSAAGRKSGPAIAPAHPGGLAVVLRKPVVLEACGWPITFLKPARPTVQA